MEGAAQAAKLINAMSKVVRLEKGRMVTFPCFEREKHYREY
jgi:hypothetical protein